MQDHRKPPKPPFYDTDVPGQCRYCGEDILKPNGTINKRASWHKTPCLEEYKLIYWPAETRKAVWRRDRGRCYICNKISGGTAWDVEHIRPLYEANGDIEYWKLDNCGTACKACHFRKTGEEATARAEQRRQMKGTGTKPKKGRTKPRQK